MSNKLYWFETEPSNNYDKIAVAYLKSLNISVDLLKCNGTAFNNRGNSFEIAFFRKPNVNSGLHEISKSDGLFKGEPVEYKYITPKTKCSVALKGTICKTYIITFNNGKTITTRKIKISDAIVKDNHMSYKDNYKLGEIISEWTYTE